MLIGGAVELLLIGWATSRPITNLPLVILDHDKSAASRALVIELENTGTFVLQEQAYDMATIQEGMDRGTDLCCGDHPSGLFKTGFHQQMGKPVLQVLLNGSEVTPARAAQSAIEGVVAQNQRAYRHQSTRNERQRFRWLPTQHARLVQ